MNGSTNNVSYAIGLLNAMAHNASNGQIISAILPCKAGDGATAVVKDIVKCAQKSGKRLALLDLDIFYPTDFSNLKITKADLWGFVNKAQKEQIACPKEGVLWIGPGENKEKLAADLGIQEVKNLIDRLKDNFDIIIFDCPPVLGSNICETISLNVEQSYLVVKQESTTYFQVNHAIERLRRIGVEPAGIILSGRRLTIPRAFYKLLFQK